MRQPSEEEIQALEATIGAEMFRKMEPIGAIGPAPPRTEAIVAKPVTEN